MVFHIDASLTPRTTYRPDTMICRLRPLRYVLLILGLAPLALGAQASRRIAGFGIAYTAPSGWTLAGADGRVEAWGRAGSDGALIVYSGMYSNAQLAVADGAAMLSGAQFRGTPTILEPLAQRHVGGVNLWTSAMRVQTPSGDLVTLRLLARATDGETMLGVVTLAAPQADNAYRLAAEQVLSTVRPGTPVGDRAASTALAGAWRWQESNMSSTGGYVSEEGWDLAQDGTFVHWTTSTVSLAGAAVEPTRTRTTGRWEVMGGALVVRASDGTTTLSLKHRGREANIAGRRFLRR
jgi:hypothetical protein